MPGLPRDKGDDDRRVRSGQLDVTVANAFITWHALTELAGQDLGPGPIVRAERVSTSRRGTGMPRLERATRRSPACLSHTLGLKSTAGHAENHGRA